MDIKESLHPWDKAHLVMMYDLLYDLFNMLWDSVCSNFLMDFASMFISDIGLYFSFGGASLSGFGIRMMVAS